MLAPFLFVPNIKSNTSPGGEVFTKAPGLPVRLELTQTSVERGRSALGRTRIIRLKSSVCQPFARALGTQREALRMAPVRLLVIKFSTFELSFSIPLDRAQALSPFPVV